ncbi:MAG TPA: CoA-transferase, partial [Ilumatobacter sp.]|nr:CoA-transferase [Ilumatobacter sp.]
VAELDFITSLGHGHGGDHRERLGLRGAGPSEVITDLGILRPDPVSKELTLTSVHPGVTVDQVREATGWELAVADDVTETEQPTADELRMMRDLKAA